VAANPAEILAGLGVLAARLQPLGLPLGAPLGLAGLAALTVATRRRRPLAAAGLAAVGALCAVALRGPISAHLGVSLAPAAAILASAGAVAGALVPSAFPFAAAALPGALAGAELPLAGRAALGAAAGALGAGVVGLLLSRLVTAAASSLAGGLALGLGLLAAFRESPLARELAGRPAALAGFALVAGIAGAALQLSRPAATTRGGPAARSPGSLP
jgi:hypothetical protein